MERSRSRHIAYTLIVAAGAVSLVACAKANSEPGTTAATTPAVTASPTAGPLLTTPRPPERRVTATPTAVAPILPTKIPRHDVPLPTLPIQTERPPIYTIPCHIWITPSETVPTSTPTHNPKLKKERFIPECPSPNPSTRPCEIDPDPDVISPPGEDVDPGFEVVPPAHDPTDPGFNPTIPSPCIQLPYKRPQPQ